MKPKIFFIEDETTPTIALYKSAMERKDLDVVQYTTTDAAIHALETENPDLVVLDLLMDAGRAFAGKVVHGEADAGFLVFQELRKHHKTTPVIVLTNYFKFAKSQFSAEPALQVVEKAETPPSKFAQVVIDALKQSGLGPIYR